MKSIFKLLSFSLTLAIAFVYMSCSKDVAVTNYATQNVIVVVVDGARYTETWGEPNHQFIPHRSSMLSEGVFCNRFYNQGTTSTVPGHTAMCTGVYQEINNGGAEYPMYPSFLQCWLHDYHRPASEAWVITTKDKLAVLSNCTHADWKDHYVPNTDCGINGLGTGYREDSTTFRKVKQTLKSYHPRLMLINFKQPDAAGHANDSMAYLQGIMDTDNYVYQLWNEIQNDDFYKNRTTLLVTNDHGRHTAGHLNGFVTHGDDCDGCRHIELFGLGPDFKKNYISSVRYEQIDIANTVAQLLGIQMPFAKGRCMSDILK